MYYPNLAEKIQLENKIGIDFITINNIFSTKLKDVIYQKILETCRSKLIMTDLNTTFLKEKTNKKVKI